MLVKFTVLTTPWMCWSQVFQKLSNKNKKNVYGPFTNGQCSSTRMCYISHGERKPIYY